MVVGVTHDFKLNFLVALDALFHQYLMDGGEVESVDTNLLQLLLVIGKAAAGAAQSKGGAQHHGVADAQCSGLGFFQRVGDFRGNNRLTDGLAHFLEQLPVFCPLNGGEGGAQQLHPALLQNALLFQLHGQVQAGLTADAGNDGIGALVTNNLCNVFQGQGLHVHLVCNGGVGHDGGGVGVCQDDLVAFLFQCQARLGAGVVKFRCLTNHDGAGADDEYFFDVCSLCHYVVTSLKLGKGFPDKINDGEITC